MGSATGNGPGADRRTRGAHARGAPRKPTDLRSAPDLEEAISPAWRPSRCKKMTWKVLRLSNANRSEEHTSELQSLMRISYAVFCLKKKKRETRINKQTVDKKLNTQYI